MRVWVEALVVLLCDIWIHASSWSRGEWSYSFHGLKELSERDSLTAFPGEQNTLRGHSNERCFRLRRWQLLIC